MRLTSQDESKVIVKVLFAKRDARETVDGKKNPAFGKIVYETYKSHDVYDATVQAIDKIVTDSLVAAAARK